MRQSFMNRQAIAALVRAAVTQPGTLVVRLRVQERLHCLRLFILETQSPLITLITTMGLDRAQDQEWQLALGLLSTMVRAGVQVQLHILTFKMASYIMQGRTLKLSMRLYSTDTPERAWMKW